MSPDFGIWNLELLCLRLCADANLLAGAFFAITGVSLHHASPAAFKEKLPGAREDSGF